MPVLYPRGLPAVFFISLKFKFSSIALNVENIFGSFGGGLFYVYSVEWHCLLIGNKVAFVRIYKSFMCVCLCAFMTQ